MSYTGKILTALAAVPETLRALAEGRSAGWPALRRAHLLVEPACTACGTRADLDVHHVRPFHLYPELELDAANLQTLCGRCHLLIGHLGTWEAWNPDALKNARWLLEKVRQRPRRRLPLV